MSITADIPAASHRSPAAATPLPIPASDQVDRVMQLVREVYAASTPEHRALLAKAHSVVLAGEVQRLRGSGQRPADDQVEHALAAARQSDRHPSGSNLRVLADEVERLVEIGEADAEHLAWLLLREQAVRGAWENLTEAQRADVPAALADELAELCEQLDGDSRAERELARLRAVEAAAREVLAYPVEDTPRYRLRAALQGGA